MDEKDDKQIGSRQEEKPSQGSLKLVLSRRDLLLAVPTLGAGLLAVHFLRRSRPVRVGVLHSLSGPMALSEKKVMEATCFALKELNARDGVLGHPVESVVVDGASDPEVFARQAEQLITKEAVSAIFGCWTSSSRRATLPVIERHGHLLFYPLQYEGIERSRCVVYTGSVSNQQILPALQWARLNLGRRFYLVGSDYVFPRAAHQIIRGTLARLRGEVVGEAFLPLGERDVSAAVAGIVAARPDAILSTINGDTNLAFFKAVRGAGIKAERTPIVSFSLSEIELEDMEPGLADGNYAVWPYFQSLRSRGNLLFVRRFQEWARRPRAIGAPMVAAYLGVHLWARAVEAAGTQAPAQVREAIRGRSINGPQGMVYVDPENLHTWQRMHVGRARGGQYEVVWSTSSPIAPEPYPSGRTAAEWDGFLAALNRRWGGQWAPPVPAASSP